MNKHFFIVGAQRAGTSYLYHVLNEHPMIAMAEPIKPEPKFFLKAIDGLGEADYLQQHFSGKDSNLLLGEKSTSYIESEAAARAIASWYPDAKILMILREPIARAISNYHFSANNKLETLPIDEAFLQEEARRENYDKSKISASPYAYLQRGRYMDYIQKWLKYFPREQVHVMIHEETVGSLEELQRLYLALGVDAAFVPQALSEVKNASEKEDLPELSPELRAYMQHYFAESNAALEAFLGRAIPDWA